MNCKVPGCKQEATHTYAMAPVCEYHRDDLQYEALENYMDRPMFESIRQFTPWKHVEAGDVHKAKVRTIRNGKVTVYEIKGGRYVLDHPNAYKGVKVL